MKFNSAGVVENVVWDMKLADLPRGENRSQINDLANGNPPYSDDEVNENNIKTNVNFLEATKLLLDARRQFTNGFIKPGNFFNITLDYGPKHKRAVWGKTLTKLIGNTLKGSLKYLEVLRSQFAGVVLHGVGPSYWTDRERWLPEAIGIEDVLIPSGTLVSLDNLQHFAVFRQFTAAQLWKLTQGPRVDPAWNIDLVNSALKWATKDYKQQVSYSEVYSPEKMSENFKQDMGLYSSDAIPTIDTWDFYFWNDAKKQAGWNRRIIMDTPSTTGNVPMSVIETKDQFLYNPKDRIYGHKLSEIIHFQFGDLSSVPPFRYHSVRSLGFLIFAVCHLQNRLRCKFMDHVMESLMQYFRVSNQDEIQKLRKIDLVNHGVIPNDLNFVPAGDRWQIDQQLIENAIEYNRMMIGDNSAPFTSDSDYGKPKGKETATKTAMKAQAASQMVTALLTLAYEYQEHQYREICRRFCIKNSKDVEVRKFRLAALKEGLPVEALCTDYWKIDAERVLGGGNKMIEMQQAQALMQARPMYDPESQRLILRDFTLATTDDPGRTEQLVPLEVNHISDSLHDAQVSIGTLLAGMQITPKPGMNVQEYIEVWLQALGMMIQQAQQRGGMMPPDRLNGCFNIAKHVEQYVQILAQDPAQKQRVKQYSDNLGQAMNLLKAFAQRLQEMQKKQQQQNGNGSKPDPQAMVKAQSAAQLAQIKLQNTATSHALKTQQRQQSWVMDEKRKQQDHEMELRREFDKNAIENQKAHQQMSLEHQRSQIKAFEE
jgi:hypothetical protein